VSEIVDRINRELAMRYKIRLGHHEEDGKCAECGQEYPCITIQSLSSGEQIMASETKPPKKKK
jgi:hypothetical protein